MGSRVVIKFGGADLATGEKISFAAHMVAKAPFEEKVVVVSAMGKSTDNLVSTIEQLGGVNDEDYAEIVSMGERTSARIFCSALRSQGVKAEFIDPASRNWPIITDSCFREATPSSEKTKVHLEEHIAPLIVKGIIPVVCGFLGKDERGRVTTLGRGGSDTTALLIANCLQADQVILVKETNGVLSADPKIVPEARFLGEMDVHEAFDLAQGGAKIVKPEALKYKLYDQKLRVVSFGSRNLAEGGTEITGGLNLNMAVVEAVRDLISINIVCDVNSKNLKEVFSALQDKHIHGISSGKRSISIFTTDGNTAEVINRLHNLKDFKAISHREKVAMLQVSHPAFIDSPGGVARISAALSQTGINILEVTTSKATINVFIEEERLKSAKEAIESVSKA